jgi:hypothetical protein
MPIVDATRVPIRGDHWRAAFPDGERTYPSRESMQRAASRIGIAVRFEPRTAVRTAVTPPTAVGDNGRRSSAAPEGAAIEPGASNLPGGNDAERVSGVRGPSLARTAETR